MRTQPDEHFGMSRSRLRWIFGLRSFNPIADTYVRSQVYSIVSGYSPSCAQYHGHHDASHSPDVGTSSESVLDTTKHLTSPSISKRMYTTPIADASLVVLDAQTNMHLSVSNPTFQCFHLPTTFLDVGGWNALISNRDSEAVPSLRS